MAVDAQVLSGGGRVSGEPEKLVLPAAAIQELVALALRTEVGAALWRGFVLAHGEPSWLTGPHWRLHAADGVLLPVREVE